MSHLPAVAGNEGVVERARSLLGDNLVAVVEAVGELTLIVKRQSLYRVLEQLRDAPDLAFDQMLDIAGADWPERAERFDVSYHLLSLRHNRRLRVKVLVNDVDPIPSIVAMFPNAGWLEREVWDCYGVYFEGNPDLRRILTDYGFEGHPFRKDFPLTGHVELHYSEEQARVVYAPVKLKQDFRNFDFLSPWEGQWQLPGDEKAENPEAGK
ncbi:NADH-quinone oxidoreductase subunit C [Sandaracinobacter sp. RS1-74]|uniref:NADH-quinone oxidoreductase subunit C n=1 Tax=Sandaracinobacteroides sayramensis TaxID=2913411 RepID=UPI001EDC253D|nr:NADH-quinone oxidoreductase subunit C [Sandaracinobacteroides sayramensis]MCG2842398.1 NADH-quinone oxidoreductase subunit C [Sandaracinobacteroides sayramensis]